MKIKFDKPMLMIHEFKDEYLNLPLGDYILTFDDGLYTQYKYFDELLKFKTLMVFSISTNIICDVDLIQKDDFIHSHDAHLKAFSGNYENYMNEFQIKEILNTDGCIVAGHGHTHSKISNIERLIDKVKFIKDDSKKMFDYFHEHFNYRPNIFCFPYNNEYMFYKGILRENYNIEYFIGDGRISIENLL